MYEDLEELCEVLSDELSEVVDKLRDEEMTPSHLEYVDRLTHAIKSVVILKEMKADEPRKRRRREKSRDIISELDSLAENAPDPQTKAEIRKFVRTLGG